MSTTANPETGDKLDEQTAGEDTQVPEQAQSDAGAPEWLKAQMSEFKAFFQNELNSIKAAQQPKTETKPKAEPKVKPKDVEDPTSEYEQRIAELERQRDEALRKSETSIQKALLLQNGLRSARFATQILSEYDGQEDFGEFIEKCKKDKDLSLLFTSANQPTSAASDKADPPSGPSGGNGARMGNTKSAEAQLRALAESMWPKDKSKQDAFIRNRLAMEKRS